MLSGKDINIDKDGNLVINGDKHALATQAEIDNIADDLSDLEILVGDISETGVTGSTVAAQIKAVNDTTGDITQTGVTGATVAAQLETLGEEREKTSITPTLENNFSMDHGVITVCNKICYFAPNLYSSATFTVGTTITVGQLPNNCIPKVSLKIACINETADILGVLMISDQGEITYYPKSTNRFFGYVNASFEVN